jgi:ribonuclease E
MTKRMLIDGINPEQTRVVIMDGNTLLDFDTEIASQRTLKGNIYLAKITRVEPSLQAAFVDYGGNRHGFLPFSEIHPDYYRIPVADREALKASMRKQRSSRDDEDDIDDDEDGSVSDLEETDDQDVMDAADNAQNDDRDDDQDDDSGSDGDDETALNVAEELPPLELAAEASGQEVAPEAAQPEPSAETVESHSVRQAVPPLWPRKCQLQMARSPAPLH